MANKKHDFEFFGPHGPALIMVFLPLTLYGLVYACNANGTLQLSPTFSLPGFSANQKYFTLEALAAYVAWFFLILGLHLVLPGASVKGVKLPNDKQLTYKLNCKCSIWIDFCSIVCMHSALSIASHSPTIASACQCHPF